MDIDIDIYVYIYLLPAESIHISTLFPTPRRFLTTWYENIHFTLNRE